VIIRGYGDNLPFEANSFDISTAFGVFHHVPNVVSVLSEMMRVSKKAIFISDANRFAQGPLVSRLFKLAGYKLGLKRLFRFVQTRGKGYWISEGDGVYYSFSVFDLLPQLNQWASKVELVALNSGPEVKMKSLLLQADQILVCAYK
jgi:ubiquinone/menaquinone biosynthesis C-methylase UbiE